MKKTIVGLFLMLFLFGAELFSAGRLEQVWVLEASVKGPETVVFDAKRNCLYISNYDLDTPNDELGSDFITQLSLDGQVLEEKWVDGVSSPLGMEIHDDKLYVVERLGISVIEIETRKTVEKIQVPDGVFLNDLSIDVDGTIYATDPSASAILRVQGGIVSKWLSGDEFPGVNGIMVDGDSVLIGTSGEPALKRINKDTGELTVIAQFESGILDGIQKTNSGYFVSLYRGELYLVETGKEPVRLLNTSEGEVSCANFLYISEKNLFVIPELRNNSISAYKLVE